MLCVVLFRVRMCRVIVVGLLRRVRRLAWLILIGIRLVMVRSRLLVVFILWGVCILLLLVVLKLVVLGWMGLLFICLVRCDGRRCLLLLSLNLACLRRLRRWIWSDVRLLNAMLLLVMLLCVWVRVRVLLLMLRIVLIGLCLLCRVVLVR